MKRIMLLLNLLWVGLVGVSAQQETGETNLSIEKTLHEEAVKALDTQQFEIAFHTEDWRSSRRLSLDSRRNFLIVDGEKGLFQTSYYSDFSNKNSMGYNGLEPLKMYEVDIAKTEKKIDKKGNIQYTVLFESKNVIRGKNIKEATVKLKKGENSCVVEVKYKHGDSSIFMGSLYPINVANIERGISYR